MKTTTVERDKKPTLNRKIRQWLYGAHLTPAHVFKRFILPEIEGAIRKYKWVDMFAGDGGLILPILELISPEEREDFFREHVFLFDIQEEMVERAVANAVRYGISERVARRNITQRDSIGDYPVHILDDKLPVFHISNPPYLHVGRMKKHPEARKWLRYFTGVNEGYQDLYHVALLNDLRHSVPRAIYIVPSNFLFSGVSARKIRQNFLHHYHIEKAVLFDQKVFEHTDVSVVVLFCERKKEPRSQRVSFNVLNVGDGFVKERVYTLSPENGFKAGGEFDEFVSKFEAPNPLTASWYLRAQDLAGHEGDNQVEVVDASNYNRKTGEYARKTLHVDNTLYTLIKSNRLFIRTTDTGRDGGEAGLYLIKDKFGVDGILVSKTPQRRQPIQLFLHPSITQEEQLLLMRYVNLLLQYFRDKTDGAFMSTFRHSSNGRTRKYLGLSQAAKLIRTFPILNLDAAERRELEALINKQDGEGVVEFVARVNTRRR